MTDKKLTDLEIVKALEICMDMNKRECSQCYCYHKIPCTNALKKDVLTLINRLQEENENYSKNNQQMTSDILKLYKELEQVKAENERFKNSWKADVILTIRTEAYKEFAELYKSKLDHPHIQKQGIDFVNFLRARVDDTLRETAGANNE